ncbi:MAG: hypothetical protein ACOCTG_05620 [Bacteroidota bacterium]
MLVPSSFNVHERNDSAGGRIREIDRIGLASAVMGPWMNVRFLSIPVPFL